MTFTFCVAGAVFGEVGGWMPVAPRIVNDVTSVSTITHDTPFAWQGQYLVRCEADAACSAHCT